MWASLGATKLAGVPSTSVHAVLRELVVGLEAFAEVVGIAGDVLVWHAHDTREEHAVGGSERTVLGNEERVVDELAGAVGDRRRRQPLHVAVDRLQQVDAEAALLLEAVQVVVLVLRDRIFAAASRILAAVVGNVLRARRAALAPRVSCADGAGTQPRHPELFRGTGARGEVAEAGTDGAIVFVGEHDDGNEGVGSYERPPLREQLRVDPDGDGLVPFDGEALGRLRIDQEAVPALEGRLVPASALAHPLDELGDVGDEGVEIVLPRRVELAFGVPGQKAVVLVGLHRGGAIGDVGEQVGLAVDTRGDAPPRSLKARLAQAEARRDDADVDVEDGLELAMGALGAFARRPPDGHRRHRRVGIIGEAHRVHQRLDELGHRERENGLLVGHRLGVVDRDEDVDLVDLPVAQRLGVGGRRARLDRLEGSIETCGGEEPGAEQQSRGAEERSMYSHGASLEKRLAQPPPWEPHANVPVRLQRGGQPAVTAARCGNRSESRRGDGLRQRRWQPTEAVSHGTRAPGDQPSLGRRGAATRGPYPTSNSTPCARGRSPPQFTVQV